MQPKHTTRPTSSPTAALPLAAALAAVSLAYANSLHNAFHFDDFHTIVDNPAIRTLHNIPRFFTGAAAFSVLPANRTYRPIVSTSLAIDYALGHGYAPLWFHLSTLALFLALIALLYKLYRLLLDRTCPPPANRQTNKWLALFAATWFGLHPAMAETVNYVIQRGDLYCTLGCVAALYLYARAPHLRRSGLYLIPFAFAALSKPPAAVVPLLLALYVFLFESPTQPTTQHIRRALIAAIPSAALTALLLALQSAMTPKTFLPTILSASDYRLTQPYVWLRYTAALFLPLHLNVDSDLTAFSTLTPQAIAGIAFLAALAIAIYITARRRTLYPIAFGLLWFVVTQLPTSLYPLSEVENDHRMFFSFPGLILAAVWTAHLLLERFVPLQLRTAHRQTLAAIAVAILCAYAFATHQRNTVWHTEESLWLDDIQKSPHNGRGLMIYGLTQMNRGAYPAALDLFTRALAFTPNYPALEINLGIVNAAIADQTNPADPTRTAEAARHFQRAIALAPNDDQTHAFYARWLSQHSRTTEAITELQTAIALNPARPLQHELLIDTYTRAGDLTSARAAAQQTLALAPTDTPAQQFLTHPPTLDAAFWINLSLAQYRQALYPQSIDSARRALALNPNSAEAWNNIAAGNEALRQWDQAIPAARRAVALNPNLQIARNNLAWSLTQQANTPPATSAHRTSPTTDHRPLIADR